MTGSRRSLDYEEISYWKGCPDFFNSSTLQLEKFYRKKFWSWCFLYVLGALVYFSANFYAFKGFKCFKRERCEMSSWKILFDRFLWIPRIFEYFRNILCTQLSGVNFLWSYENISSSTSFGFLTFKISIGFYNLHSFT